MLSGEGNAGERWKTTIDPISKKSNSARAALFFSTFLCRCFARLQRETSRNFLVTRFMEEMSYVFSFTFLSLPLIFTLHWWPLAFLILSEPLQNFHVVLPSKNVSFVFYLSLQISVALFLAELRWPAAYFLFISAFLLLYIPNLCTWQLILANYFTQHGYRNNFRFPFSPSLPL